MKTILHIFSFFCFSLIFLNFSCNQKDFPFSDHKKFQKNGNNLNLFEIGTTDILYKEKQVYYIKSTGDKKNNKSKFW